jgi:hypothetical protein
VQTVIGRYTARGCSTSPSRPPTGRSARSRWCVTNGSRSRAACARRPKRRGISCRPHSSSAPSARRSRTRTRDSSPAARPRSRSRRPRTSRVSSRAIRFYRLDHKPVRTWSDVLDAVRGTMEGEGAAAQARSIEGRGRARRQGRSRCRSHRR